jgi:hypothetical protein
MLRGKEYGKATFSYNAKFCVNSLLGFKEKRVEALGGVEPPTCGLGNRRSIHLSYRAMRTYVYYRTVKICCGIASHRSLPAIACRCRVGKLISSPAHS